MAQQYSLKWNNHQPNFISMFAMLRNTQGLVDVTLAAEGRHLHAHKMVLSACSPYFHSLFVENPSQHPIVILKDITFSDLRTIVDFMYYGEVNITQEELPQMLHSAKSLKVKGLTETESTSVMRSQSSDFPFEAPGETSGEQATEPTGEQTGEQSGEHSAQQPNDHDNQGRPGSPTNPPTAKRRRRRPSSSGSASLQMVPEDAAATTSNQLEMERVGLTLSSVPRRRDFAHPEENTQQNADPHNISLDLDQAAAGMPQGAQWSMMDSYPRYTNSCFGAGALQGEAGAGAGASAGAGAAPMYMAGGMMQLEGELAYGGGPSCAPPAAPPQHEPAPPPKRRRTTNPQSEENFQRALEAVRIGGIGFCKAARLFGVNNRTLWLEYKKKGYPNNRPSIKSRIKREHATPPPLLKEELAPPDHHMALVCHPAHAHSAHQVSVNFVDSTRPIDLPLHSMNLLGQLNFNAMQ